MTDRTVKVKLGADVNDYRRSVTVAAKATDNLRDRAERFAKGKYDASLALDVKRAEKQLQSFTSGLQARVKAAVKSLPEVKLTADASDVDKRVAAIRRELASLSDQRIGIDVDATTAAATVADLSEELRQLAAQSPDVRVSASTGAASAALTAVDQQVTRLDGRTAKVNVKVDGAAQGIVGIAALGRAMGQLALPAAIVAATPALVSLSSSAVQASGAVALLPAALGAAATAAGTLAVGVDGIGESLEAFAKEDEKVATDAIKNAEGMTAGAAKAAYAYRQLSDSGRGLVDSLRAQAPAWNDLKLDVQERLLTGVGSQVTTLADNYLPMLRGSLSETAGSFNTAFAMSANFLNLPSTLLEMSMATGNVTTGLTNASGAMKPLLQAFTDLYTVGSEFLPALGNSVTSVADRFRQFIATARETGDLKRWIQEGIDVFNQLGRIAANTGGILGSVLGAVDRSGRSFLETLELMTGRIDAALKTPEDAAKLELFFTTVRDLTRTVIERMVELWPAVQAASGAFAALVTEGAPLAATITDLVVSGLVPLLRTVEALAPVLGPIAVSMGAVALAGKGLSVTSAGWTGAFNLLAPSAVLTRLDTATGMIDSTGAATERAATKTGTFAGGLTRVGSYLPVAGVAVAAYAGAMNLFTISQDEATAALLAGGAAADQATGRLQQQTGVITFLDENIGKMAGDLVRDFGPSMDEATAAAQRQFNTMTPLGQAQTSAAWAANEHSQAVKTFGPNSWQAAAAAAGLQIATDQEAIAQRAASDATKSHTDRLAEQQDQMLAAVNTELAMRQSTLAMEQSQRSLSQAVDQYGVDSLEARQATLGYEESLLRNVQAVGANALEQAKLRGETDPTRFATEAQNRAIQDLINKAGGQAPPALQALADGMRNSGGQARGAAVGVYELNRRVSELPPARNIDIIANTQPARAALERLIGDYSTRQIELATTANTGNITAGATPYRGRALGGVDMMATGGARSMRRDVAQMVPPNQPVLMGDRMRGREWFLPDDNAPRTIAAGQDWAASRGLRLVPMAAGGVLRMQAGGMTQVQHSSVPPDVGGKLQGMGYRGDPADQMEALYVPPDVLQSLQDAETRFASLAETVHGATTGMTGSIGALNLFSNTSWADMRARAGAEVEQMIGPLFGALNLGHRNAELSQLGLQNLNNSSWANIAATTGMNVGHITGPVFGGLHAGMSSINQHGTQMADGWSIELNRLRAAAADPIRWVMQWPLGPPGLAASWNTLDDQFKLGKRVNPPVPGFAAGGPIFAGLVRGPGTSTSDSVPAVTEHGEPLRVSDREYVMPAHVTEQHLPFLEALRNRQAEAIQAAGGSRARGPGYAAGGVIAAEQFFRSQDNKPYQWGGTGNPSWDCSGYMSGGTRALRGQNPFGGRLGTTATFPWSGFRAGMGAFTIGNTKSRGHMAGTLAGTNVESGGAHGVHYGPPAIGADNRMFDFRAFLPEVGGVFTPGGAGGGGGGIDPTPIVDGAFRRAYELVNDTTRWFGNSTAVLGSQGMARQTTDAVKAKAMEAVSAAVGGGGLGPLGAGAPFYVAEISRSAKAHGLGVDGATIGAATGLVESNLRILANRRVPESFNYPHDGTGGDHDSIGIFQQRQAGWGTVAQRMNAFASANMFFDRFPGNWRSMDPGAVAQSVQRSAFPGRYSGKMGQARGLVGAHGGFDDGGDWPSGTIGFNTSGRTEHVLRGPERAAFLDLVQVLRAPPRPVPVAPIAAPALPDMAILVPAVAREVGKQVAAHLDGVQLKFADDGQAGVGRIANRQNFLSSRRE